MRQSPIVQEVSIEDDGISVKVVFADGITFVFENYRHLSPIIFVRLLVYRCHGRCMCDYRSRFQRPVRYTNHGFHTITSEMPLALLIEYWQAVREYTGRHADTAQELVSLADRDLNDLRRR